MFLRITDKDGNFLRDGETFDPGTEIGLDVDPAHGLYKPRWNGESWEEGATQEYIDGILAQQPTEPQPTLEDLAERVQESSVLIMELSIDE